MLIGSRLKTGFAVGVLLGLAGCNTSDVGGALGSVSTSLVGGFETLTSGALFSDEYLADRTDLCFRQRTAMAEQGSFFDKELVAGAVGGAASVGLIAALRGDNVWQNALIGGASGLAGGYLTKLVQDGRSGDAIVGQAFGDVQAENQRIDSLNGSFRALRECRLEEGRAIQAAYSAGTLSQADAQARMSEVRRKFGEDIAKFREIAAQISENTEGYAAIYNEIAADNRSGALEVREYKPGRKSVHLKRNAPKKQTATPPGRLKAENKGQVKKLQDECLTNVRKRDETIEEIRKAEAGEETLELDLA